MFDYRLFSVMFLCVVIPFTIIFTFGYLVIEKVLNLNETKK